ncbi:MAG: protein kinase [Acidimicrobiia bacterium]|nr:protein kinase [Acidimicrobiia bacterium]
MPDGSGGGPRAGTVGHMVGQSVSDLAGRVLAGRYRLLAPIGTGASGRVYVAEDTRLRRRVAVKVLHAALADDSGFLRRFRAEAQVAASLHHPNIMTVHDWGEEDVPFMVLELLSGGSLRAMLDEGTRLSPAQAARIGRDVSAALEYAHARGIVHRDIKPANLLFDEHGIVRVADFGLARALAEASWTEPAGAVLGTARYASPEQALGVPLDARSDLYSLALVLVEGVTGRVPFAADTTIGTLAARTQRPILAPAELGPLRAVIDRAGRIEADDRYPDAATMGAALSDAGEALPPPSPLLLPGTSEREDPHPTRAHVAQPARPFDQDADAPLPESMRPPPSTRRSTPRGRRPKVARRRLVPWFVSAALIAAIALSAAALSQIGSDRVEVPGLVGRTESAARTGAQAAGLEISVAERRSADDPAGIVLSQSPDPGSRAREDSKVRLVVSTGPAPVAVPRRGAREGGGRSACAERRRTRRRRRRCVPRADTRRTGDQPESGSGRRGTA